jgi:1,2-diacylglycerol 3-alpha-glucosyltransferase
MGTMKRMHIAHFTNAYLPVISGVVRSVSTFRKSLTEMGHNVFVFAQEDNHYIDQEPFIFRYPSLHLRFPVEIPAVIPMSPFVDRLIPSLKLDVVHTHHPVLLGQAAATKAQELDLPLIFTFHTQYREYSHYFPFPQEAVQKFVKEAVSNWLKEFMVNCQHIVVPSQSMLEILRKDYGLKDHYTVIPTGIDLRPFIEADGESARVKQGWEQETIMISVGRLAPEKNWRTLIEATSMAIRNDIRLRLVIIGEGPERNNLEHFSQTLGIADQVKFLGEVAFSEIPALLKAADFFGFASTTETQGLVTMEALAAGLPVVAVDASGTRDVVENNRQGFLVKNDPQALANAISELLQTPELLKKFSAQALDRIQAFEIMGLTKNLLNVYEQAIQDKKENQFVGIQGIRKEV